MKFTTYEQLLISCLILIALYLLGVMLYAAGMAINTVLMAIIH